jgi:hypothetical protein
VNVVNVALAPKWLSVLRLVISGLYRLVVSAGTLYLIYSGQSPWVILVAVPLLILGPRSR